MIRRPPRSTLFPTRRSSDLDTRALVPQYQRRRRSWVAAGQDGVVQRGDACCCDPDKYPPVSPTRSEEHTSELQSQSNLVCRLLLEKKKKQNTSTSQIIDNNS